MVTLAMQTDPSPHGEVGPRGGTSHLSKARLHVVRAVSAQHDWCTALCGKHLPRRGWTLDTRPSNYRSLASTAAAGPPNKTAWCTTCLERFDPDDPPVLP